MSADPRGAEPEDAPILAAVVYGGGTPIETLMGAFTEELAGQGLRLGGVIQVDIPGRTCGPNAPMLVKDVTTGELITISQDLGPCAESCRLDPHGLAEAAMRIRNAVERDDVHLLLVSKFGKEEAAGRGLRDEIAMAAASGRPVLTIVRKSLVEDWLTFTGGAGTLIEPKAQAIRAWWDGVAPRQVAA